MLDLVIPIHLRTTSHRQISRKGLPTAITMAPQPTRATGQATQASHTTAVNVLQSFPFLKLPAELHNKIYRSLLVYDRTLLPGQCRRSYSPCIDTQVLRVKNQIFKEARDILLEENVFQYPELNQSYSVDRVLKRASKLRATFSGDAFGHDRSRADVNIASFVRIANILLQNSNLRSLRLTFLDPNDRFLKACQKILPRLESIQVRDEVVFLVSPRQKYRYART